MFCAYGNVFPYEISEKTMKYTFLLFFMVTPS